VYARAFTPVVTNAQIEYVYLYLGRSQGSPAAFTWRSVDESAIADPIAEFVKGRDFRMLIRGDLVGAADDQTAETVNPSTGEPVSEVPEGTAEDVARAIKAANRCLWPDPCCWLATKRGH